MASDLLDPPSGLGASVEGKSFLDLVCDLFEVRIFAVGNEPPGRPETALHAGPEVDRDAFDHGRIDLGWDFFPVQGVYGSRWTCVRGPALFSGLVGVG